ncbi:Frizzled-4 [Halotydeus destructor]|nr:Frizzled-4 [Halotydeus destructor]
MKPTPVSLVILIVTTIRVTSTENVFESATCEPIRLEKCQGIGYNYTSMPNLIGHELQQDAELQLETFVPLIQYGCSSQLKFFLCSVYVPMCTEELPKAIGPCRSLCESVKNRCQPVLVEFGFYWPAALNCSKFPEENNVQHMCMEGPREQEASWHVTEAPVVTEWPQVVPPKKKPSRTRGRVPKTDIVLNVDQVNQVDSVQTKKTQLARNNYGLCSMYKMPEDYYYINRTERCAQACSSDILFSKDNKQFADLWTLIWSALCAISTLLTIVTFTMASSKVHYSERVIMFMSVTYLMHSMAYFVILIVGRDNVSCARDPQHGQDILIQEGLDNLYCTVVFVLLYYFSMAGLIWWVVLTITWFQGTGLGLSSEVIQRRCSIYYAAAWGLPGLKVLAILVLRAVDGDELTGTCYVGNQNVAHLLWFIIVPTASYLSIGVLFLLSGLVCVVTGSRTKVDKSLRVRHGSQQSSAFSAMTASNQPSQSNYVTSCSSSRDKTDLLNLRILIFAAFFILPASCILAANIYELLNRSSWYENGSSKRPNVEIFISKIFMSLIVGMKSGFWIWSSRTPWTAWSKMASRLKSPPMPAYVISPTSDSLARARQKQPFLMTTLDRQSTSSRPTPPIRHCSRRSLFPGGETMV